MFLCIDFADGIQFNAALFQAVHPVEFINAALTAVQSPSLLALVSRFDKGASPMSMHKL